jgi:uncharacterized protein with FMN-binding domain
MANHRIHRGLVTLSASAVAAIYMAGYLHTQAADAGIGDLAVPTLSTANAAPVVAAAPALPTATAPPVVVQRAAPTQTRAPAPTPTPAAVSQPATAAATGATQPAAPAAAAGYKDGTYNGTGSSRRGDVWVSVQVQAGQITNVTITRSTLQYPLRDIANLPSQVVQRQSAQVDVVSRATYSSTAFRTAVTQALSNAKA